MTNKTPIAEPNRTRAEEQRRINDLYIDGKLTRDEWREKTDELSDLGRWTSKGRVQR